MKRGYTVLLRAEPDGGYTVLVPTLHGCITYGETISEALSMAEKAIHCHISGLQDVGKPVPQEGEQIALPACELVGTLLVYRVSPAREAAEVA